MAIGIIGGSGLDDPKILKNAKEIEVDTPYGKPSSPLTLGKIAGKDVVILARHGRKHTIPPTQVNNRANIYALKEQGCKAILATTACGSLRDDIGRGNFVILDQFIDFTRHRKITFFEGFKEGEIKHTAMAEPFNEVLRKVLIEICKELKYKVHKKGTVITIEGPRFSTKAESRMFKNWGADEKGAATKETPVRVWEMAEDATFSQMFGELNVDVEKNCLTQHQILNFIKKYRHWLRTDGYATFFFFKSKGHFFVAGVRVSSDGVLRVDVDRFEDPTVWGAGCRRRVVVPQLVVPQYERGYFEC